MGRPAELSDFQLTAEKAKGYTDSKINEIRAVTTNTYNCNFSTSLSKLLVEIHMDTAQPSASYNLIIDGLLEQARNPSESSYFQIIIDTTGSQSNSFAAKCICTDVSKMPVLKYVVDLEARTFKLYVTAPNATFDFNYRLFIQSMRGYVPTQNVIKNTDVNEIPDTAIDVPVVQYAFLNDVQDLQSELSDLKAYIGYTDSDVYGLEADFENNKFTRLAGAVGKTPGADFDSINAFGGRKRCNLSDSGEVLAYYGDDNFKADGSNGQVMVEQPKFYYKVVPLKTEKIDGADGYHLRKARYYISDTPKAGFKVHPAFVRNGVKVDRIYLSAFEGCIYDTSAGAYLLNDEQVADFDNDTLSSIVNAKPVSGTTQALTRANARKLAQNKGAGWNITTIQTLSATQLLFMIEYATFNSQTAIGAGISTKASGSGNESEKTGATSSLGNISGSVGSGAISYRGEENLWGNIMCFVDNCDINVDSSNYLKVSINECILPVPKISSQYISAFSYNSVIDWCSLPSECLGNSVLPIGDISYAVPADTHANEIVCCAGGDWYHGGANGLYELYAQWSINTHARMGGARLIYIPQPETVTQEVTSND